MTEIMQFIFAEPSNAELNIGSKEQKSHIDLNILIYILHLIIIICQFMIQVQK